MSEEEIKKVGLFDKCRLKTNGDTFTIECPPDVVIAAATSIKKVGVLIKEIEVNIVED